MKTDFKSLYNVCLEVRKMIIQASYAAGENGAHIGGSLSIVEILVSLYYGFIKTSTLKERDRVILSKAHASLALYGVLATKGYIPKSFISEFEQNGSDYTAHAKREIEKGFEFSGGSLGLGLSYAVGVALALKELNSSSQVFAIVGDGECNEGIIWEALMFAKHKNLTNLTVIVDNNLLQADGKIEDVLNTYSLKEKFSAFGFNTVEVDGHSLEELHEALSNRSHEFPNAIIAKTHKGKGISFMELKTPWHFSMLSSKRYNKALEELESKIK